MDPADIIWTVISKQGAIIGEHEQILQFQAKSGANQSVTDSRKSYPHFQSSVQTSLPPTISHQYTQHSPRLLLLRKTLHFSLPWSLQTMPVFHDAVSSTLKPFSGELGRYRAFSYSAPLCSANRLFL